MDKLHCNSLGGPQCKSLSSFPLGCADGPADAPGTPNPSAPIMEATSWESSEDDAGSSSRHYTAKAGCAAWPSQNSSRLRHQPNCQMPHSTSCSHDQQHGLEIGNRVSGYVQPTISSKTVGASSLLATWTAAGAWCPAESNSNSGGAELLACAASPATSSIGSRKQLRHSLLSYPVEVFDLLDLPDESPTSRSGCGRTSHDLEDLAAAEQAPRSPCNRAVVAVQGFMGGCGQVARHLVGPHGLFQPSSDQGWPAFGPSLLLASVQSCRQSHNAYSSAMHACLVSCKQLQQHYVLALGCFLQQRLGLAGCGHLAAYWSATWLLGFLLFHWRLGLQLLPVAAAALVFWAFLMMDNTANSPSGNGSRIASNNALRCPGTSSSHSEQLAAYSSSGGSRSHCPLWPVKLSGLLFAAHCLLLSLVGCCWQQLGVAGKLHEALLTATQQVLLVTALLLAGQVVVEVFSRGCRSYTELHCVSLVCRCWSVAASVVLLPGSAAGFLGAVAVAQKAHLLLEGAVLVHQLGCLLVPARAAGGQQRSLLAGGYLLSAIDSSSLSSSMSAWLLCAHSLLQLLTLLFVPPAPLAAVHWLPVIVRSSSVWAVKVLLCGCLVQLLLFMMPSGVQDTEAAVARAMVSDRAAHQQIAASAPHSVPSGTGHGSGSGNINARGVRPAGRNSSGSSGRRRRSQASAVVAAAAERDDDSCYDGHPGSRSVSPSACGVLTAVTSGLSPASSTPTVNGLWQLQLLPMSPSSVAIRNVCSCTQLQGSFRVSVSGCSGQCRSAQIMAPPHQESAAATAAAIVLKQHLVYLLLLLLAAGGDMLIAAVPSASAAAVADLRAGWHVSMEWLLLGLFVCECLMTVRREAIVARYQPVMTLEV